MQALSAADLAETGLLGDHARAGKRSLTLFQAEHLPVVAGFLGVDTIPALALRRNVHVRGLNLSALRGVPLVLGRARIEITGPCAPCSRMQEAFGLGGYNALRGHGGWCAQVLVPGRVALNDTVRRAGD